MLLHMAEYCDTPESKDRRNREYKACLRKGAIPRLLDHDITLSRIPLGCELSAKAYSCMVPSGRRQVSHLGVVTLYLASDPDSKISSSD